MDLKQIYDLLQRQLTRENEEIREIVYDSRQVQAGDVFVALKGEHVDGHQFIEAVLNQGASLVIGEREFKHLNYLRVHDTKKALAVLCAAYYENPSFELSLVGVIGTNGKTTITYLIQHVFECLGINSGVIGTNGTWVGQKIKATHTTPLSKELNGLLKDAVNLDIPYVIMEVSSHGIKENRIDQLLFRRLIFTNITPEHLDYHKTFEDYLFTKMRPFNQFNNYYEDQVGIINIDDPQAPYFLNVTNGKVLTYGLRDADVCAKQITYQIDSTTFDLYIKDELINTYTIKLFGKYNVYNVLAVIAYFYSLGYPPHIIASYLELVKTVEGRFEYQKTKTGVTVVIDYAHNPDAVFQVLTCLNTIASGRVITVLGAGGNRDKLKRKVMGEYAASLSKHVVFTSDNPRNEDPLSIIYDLLTNVKTQNYTIVLERDQAIEKALSLAKSNDIVVILGKGHEKTQNINGNILPFSDKIVVEEVIRKRGI